MNCEPGVFINVFDQIQLNMSHHPEYQDFVLLCDAMNLKASTIFNKEKGGFEGFINYNEKVVVDDENKIATEVRGQGSGIRGQGAGVEGRGSGVGG